MKLQQEHRDPRFYMAGKWYMQHRLGHAGGFGGRGRNFDDFRSSRKFSASDLQLLILALLEKQERHGYELIKLIEERSGHFYTPSPGMIYPALMYLEEVGRATVEVNGPRKLYRITGEGREYLDRNRTAVDALLSVLAGIGARMEDVRRAFDREDGFGSERQREGGCSARLQKGDCSARKHDELRIAGRALKRAMCGRPDNADDAKRIADILLRAANEITGRQ